MTLTLKLNEETNAPVMTEDGKILYLDENDKELPLDPAAMYDKIGELGKQNKADRNNYTTLRNKYALFEDIEDIEDWKTKAEEALETVQNFDEKDWLAASKVEALKKDMKDGYEEKLARKDVKIREIEKANALVVEKKNAQIRRLMVSTRFASSPFFSGEKRKTHLNPEIAEAYFGKHFRVETENDELVLRAYDSKGDPINSKINPGDPAGFEEAISIIVDQYPGKDSILIAPGGGSGGGGGGETPTGSDLIAQLKEQYDEAVEAGHTTLAISLKNKMFDLQKKLAS